MADLKDPRHSTVSPLFNKMDALLARHRGSGGQDIPVLTDDSPSFPVLTNVISDDGLMFDPLEFQNNPPRFAPALSNSLPPPAPEKIAPLEPVFLDLPMLDLDGLADNPMGIADTFELEVDEPQPAVPVLPEASSASPNVDAIQHLEQVIATAHAEITHEVPLPEPKPEEIKELSQVEFDLEIDEPHTEVLYAVPHQGVDKVEFDLTVDGDIPVLQIEAALPESADAIIPPRDAVPQLPEELPAASQFALHDIAAPVEITDESEVISLTEVEEEIELSALPGDSEEEEHHLSLAEAPHEQHTILTLEHEEEPQTVMPSLEPETGPVAPALTEAAISDITASVAAQIAVEISTEVAQLTRQHFASMMNRFYSDSLRQLTEEISRDMEAHLAPRVTELVKDELRRQGLVQ